MLRLTMLLVIALASSEALKAVTLAISATLGSRRRCYLPAIGSWNCSHDIPRTFSAAEKTVLWDRWQRAESLKAI
jgi:hypothetical protein